MSTLSITVGLILITLASTTVSVFWRSTLERKLLLLVLAVCSSIRAIYQAREMERSAAAISDGVRSLILNADSVPCGFEDALLEAANEIAKRENYSRAILRKTDSELKSEYFGYGIAFLEPSEERPLTGYEELSMLAGYGHAFIHVPKSAILDLIPAFVNGSDLKVVLEEHTLWVWEKADVMDERFLLSMQGIAYLAYENATSPNFSDEFQKEPEKFWMDLNTDRRNKSITVMARRKKLYQEPNWYGVELHFMSQSDLKELVGKDAITRGGMIFYSMFEKLITDWNDPEYTPMVEGR